MENSTTQPILLTSRAEGHLQGPPTGRRLGNLVKRAMDICIGLAGLVLLSPLFLLIAMRIKRGSPGPVFYRGPRAGRYGKTFSILKFRTMYDTQESYEGPPVTAQDDPRVTPVGHWLRDTKINELPQLWNVVKGEMSLVGPRPEDPEIAASWPEEVRWEVLSVRPGVTSPASVLFRNEESMLQNGNVMDTYLGAIQPSKLRLDQLYVRHRSVLLDLDILFWTFLVLLPKVGAGSPPEEQLFLGPLSRLMRRYVRWFMIDALVTLVAIGLVGVLWRSLGPLNVGVLKSLGIALGFAVLFSLVGALMGVNRIAWSQAEMTDVLDLVPAVLVATFLALVINQKWEGQPILPMFLIVMAAVISFIGFMIVRYRIRLFRALAERWLRLRAAAIQAQERVLIVGSGETGQIIAWWLQNGQSRDVFRIAGFVDDDLYKQDTRIRGVQVLGRRVDIPKLVAQHDVGIILFAIHNIPDEERKRVLEICYQTPARVFIVPDIFANLREVANGNGSYRNKSFDQNKEMDIFEDLAEEMNTWLASLEEKVSLGDVVGAQKQIQEMRERISAEKLDATQESAESSNSS